MKLFGFLNLRGISGQIAALVVVSIVSAASDHHREFPAAPARPAGAVVRPRPRPACHSRAVARRSARVGTAAAVSPTSRAPFRSSASRSSPAGPMPAAGDPDGFNPHGLQRRLGHDYRIFQLASDGETRKLGIGLPDGTMISANVLPDRPRPPFLGGPWMMTLLFAVISVTLARPVGGARADRAAVVLRQGRREFQPERRRRAAARTRAGGNPLGGAARSTACASASPA